MTASRAELLPDIREWPAPVQATGDYYPCPDGVERVRVTRVVKHVNDGNDNLYNWYEKNGKEAALETVRRHYDWCRGMSAEAFIAKIEPEIKATKASLAKLTKAGDIGTQIHAMIQWRMRLECGGDPGVKPALSDPAEVGYMAWDDWWRASGLKPVVAEQWAWDLGQSIGGPTGIRVCSPGDGTAGQFDLLAEGPDGYELIDWKSSNYILTQHHVQVLKYRRIIEKWRPSLHIARTRIVRVPKTLDNIEIESRELGDCYDMKTKKRVRYAEHDLEALWLSALTQYRVFHP